MNQEGGFLDALVADPENIPRRLAYADWLEGRGDERAEYLRLDCRLKSGGLTKEQRASIGAKLKELRLTLSQGWLVWVHWPGYGEFAPRLPSVTHRLLPLNRADMRMPPLGGPCCVSFSHDGRFIYTCGADPHIWIWDSNTYQLCDRIETALDRLNGPVHHPAREQIAAGGVDGTVRIWDIETRAEVLCVKRHSEPVTAACFVNEGRILASGSNDGTVRLSDATTGRPVGRLKRLRGKILKLAAAAKGWTLGAVHERGVRIWNSQLEDLFRFDGVYYHGGDLQSDMAIVGDGPSVWVTLWGREPFLRIWSLARPAPVQLPAITLSEGAFMVAFSRDERLAALALRHEVLLVDPHHQIILARWAVPCGTQRLLGPPGAFAFSPDSRRLISADIAGGIWVWPLPLQ
jgi:uncharacterized protein (TIGR02996 family)